MFIQGALVYSSIAHLVERIKAEALPQPNLHCHYHKGIKGPKIL